MRVTLRPTRRRTARDVAPNGHVLAEALVGLVLGLVAVVLVARAASVAVRVQGRTAVVARGGHDAADALDAVAARLRDVVPAQGDLLEAGTALAFRAPVGTALLCRVAGDTVVLGRGDDDAPWSGRWSRDPVIRDELRALVLPASARTVRRIVAVRPVDVPCAADVRPWSVRARWAVALDAPLAVAAPGTPMRLLARERWSAYRGGDGSWALGLATWDAGAAAWGAPQPVMAPLAGSGAFAVVARDTSGAPVVGAALDRARAVVLVLRGTSRIDSVVVHVPAH